MVGFHDANISVTIDSFIEEMHASRSTYGRSISKSIVLQIVATRNVIRFRLDDCFER